MLEYGIKSITTNPTIITKTDEIIKLVDNRTHKTRAFVLPVAYEHIVLKLEKEINYKKWVQEKKDKLLLQKNSDDNLEDIMNSGVSSINEYLQ
jgi:hypothetical protein